MKRALIPIAAIAAAILLVLMVPSASSAEPLPPDPSPIDVGDDLRSGSVSKTSGVDVVAAPGEEAIFINNLAELRDANLPQWAKLDLLVDLGHLASADILDPNPPAFDWTSLSASKLAEQFNTAFAFDMAEVAKIDEALKSGSAAGSSGGSVGEGAASSTQAAESGEDGITRGTEFFGLCGSRWEDKVKTLASSGGNGDLFNPVNKDIDLGNGFKARYKASADLDGTVSLSATVHYGQKVNTCLPRFIRIPFRFDFRHADVDIKVTASGSLDVENELTLEHRAELWKHTMNLGQIKTGFSVATIFRVDFRAYLNLDLALNISSKYSIRQTTKLNQDYDINGRYEGYLRCTKSGCVNRATGSSNFNFDAVDRPQTYTQQTVDIVLTPSANLYVGIDVDVSLLGLVGNNLFHGRAGFLAEMPIRLYWTKGNDCSDANFDGLNERVQGTILDVNVQLRAYTELKIFNATTRSWIDVNVPTGWLRGLVYDQINRPTAKAVHRNIYMKVLNQGTYSPLDPVVKKAGLFPVGGQQFEGIELGGVRDCYPFPPSGLNAQIDWGDGAVTKHAVGNGFGAIAHDWANDGRNQTVKVRWLSDASTRTINGPWTTIKIDGNSNLPVPDLYVPRLLLTGDKTGPLLQWNGSKDATGYKIFRNGRLLTTVTKTSWSPVSSGQGNYRVSAFNADANIATAKSNTVVFTPSSTTPTPAGIELISDRDPAAGNFRTYAVINGSRQYLNGACSLNLMSMGVPFKSTPWKEIAKYPVLSPSMNCAKVTALVGTPAPAGFELISDRDPAAANFRTYALISGSRQYLDGACSLNLMSMGVPFKSMPWKEIAKYPLLTPRSNCAKVTAMVGSGMGGTSDKPAAVVAMGDSFISGEGGRWLGNAKSPTPTHAGTDRGAGTYLGTSAANTCHRSDNSPIFSANIAGLIPLNIACSGAKASHVTGNPFKGEPAQTKQLAELTKTYDVDLIVLSVGGNDMGFAQLMTDCVATYLAQGPTCKDDKLERKITGTVMPAVDRAIKRIQSTMKAAGDSNYRLVLQSYPSPLPSAKQNQWGQGSVHLAGERAKNGCAFYDTDLDWARNTVVPKLDAEFRKLASTNKIEFLSLQDAFSGKEVCAKGTVLAKDNNLATAGGMMAKMEWVRWASVPGLIQGDLNESFHPNALGQQALGRCLSLSWARTGKAAHTCVRGGGSPANMKLL